MKYFNLIIAIVSFILIKNDNIPKELSNYLSSVFLLSAFLSFSLYIKKVDLKPYIVGSVFGFTLGQLYLDYKGFIWVSDINNWAETSVHGWIVVLFFMIISTIIHYKNKYEIEL